MNKWLVKTLVVLASINIAFAASQGGKGTTSTGSSTVTVKVPNLVQITDVGDLTANYDGTTAVSMTDNICVYRNGSTGKYNLTATGNGTGSAFTITDGSTPIAYTVSWAPTKGATSGFQALTATTPKTGLTGASNSSGCGSAGTDATLKVDVTTTELDKINPTGSTDTDVTGTLTLVIAPE